STSRGVACLSLRVGMAGSGRAGGRPSGATAARGARRKASKTANNVPKKTGKEARRRSAAQGQRRLVRHLLEREAGADLVDAGNRRELVENEAFQGGDVFHGHPYQVVGI